MGVQVAMPRDVLDYDAVIMGTSAVVIKAANPDRFGIAISNRGTVTIFIGKDNTVTTANGFPVASGEGFYFDGYTGALWGISTISGQSVRWMEV